MSTGLLPYELLTAPLEEVYHKTGLTAPSSLFPLSTRRSTQLQTLANDINRQGGWRAVNQRNGWNGLYNGAKEDYETVWLPVLVALEAQPRPLGHISREKLRVRVVTPPVGGRLLPEFWKDVMGEEAVVLREFLEDVWELDRRLFSLEALQKEQLEQTLSVLVQERNPGKGPFQLRIANIQSLSLCDYLPLMTQITPSSPTVLSASNIDISTWSPQLQELQRCIPSSLCFQSSKDALRLTRVHISGMTLPQLYLPRTDSWTGVHQEQMNLSVLYINYGPGACEWGVVSAQYVDLLRETIQKAIGVDYMRGDGLLYLPEAVLTQANIPYEHITVQPGDMLYLGPGVAHWNSCLSSTVLTAWNLCPYSLPQFQACFRRDDINRAIEYEGLMQVYTLSLDLINIDLPNLSIDLIKYLINRVQTRFEVETKLLAEANLPNFGLFPGHQVRRCEKCRQELFYAYASCNTCASAICLLCVPSHPHPLAASCVLFTSDCYQKLLKRVRNWTIGVGEHLYDPEVNQHFTRVEREMEAEVCASPYSGARDCVFFTYKRPARSENCDNGLQPAEQRDDYVIPKRLK